MTEFKVDDRVEMIEDANGRSTGDRGIVTQVQTAEEEWGGQFLQINWEGSPYDYSDGCYSKRLKKVTEEPEEPQGKFYAGQKVRIVHDYSHHKIPIDTEVYLLGKDGDLWMASTDPDAKPEWTYAESVPAVRYLREEEVSTDVLADWEKELLAGPEDTPVEAEPERDYLGSIHYTDLKEGDTIGFTSGMYFSVYRDKVVEPEVVKPPKPETGTRGTALIDGERIPGMIDEDGDFKYLRFDGDYVDDTYRVWSNSLEFEPED